MRLLLFLLLITFFEINVFANNIEDNLPPIPLTSETSSDDVRSYVRFANNITLDEVQNRSLEEWENLNEISTPSIQFGPIGSRTFVLLSMENMSDSSGSWILTTGRGSLKFFQMYRYKNGVAELVIDGQSIEQVRENLRSYQAFSTEFQLSPAEKATYVIYFEGENSTYLPLKIQTFPDFFKARRTNIAMVASVFAGMVILIDADIKSCSKEARLTGAPLVAVSFDASAQNRSRSIGVSDIMIIKPIVAEVREHPILIALREVPMPEPL